MAERLPVSFAARDGTPLHGYLTIPISATGAAGDKSKPLVVKVHDAPFGTADQWRWDADAQMLASRGYAVMQVNYRGSGGYGKTFEDAGRDAWDKALLTDIVDATNWAAQQPGIDHRRVAIYGTGFGAYAALASAALEPKLYQCVIGWGGIYDLNSYKAQTEFESGRYNANTFVSELRDATPARFHAASPLYKLDRFGPAVLVAYGDGDLQVPPIESVRLIDALKTGGDAFDVLELSDATHVLSEPKDRVQFYNKMLSFLSDNLRTGDVKVGPVTPSLQTKTKP